MPSLQRPGHILVLIFERGRDRFYRKIVEVSFVNPKRCLL